MSSHQSNKDKPRALKCHNFCHFFDTHNFCPTCREAGKGDDPCVTFISPCNICASFTKEQMIKITHRKRYVMKQKSDIPKDDDELEMLGGKRLNPSQDLMQTWKVLQIICSPLLHVLRHLPSRHCHLKLQLNLSHPPQVLPYSRK